MGSIVGSVGAKFGLRVPITAGVANIILTSLAGPYPAASASNVYIYVAFEYGWRAFTFQLVPAGAAGLQAAISTTLDQATAQGVVGAAAWATVPPAGSGGAGNFINPITQAAGTQLCFVNSGPWAAFELTITGTPATGSAILFGAGS